jgi:hypothetical protein
MVRPAAPTQEPSLPQPEEMLIAPETAPKKPRLTFILLGIFVTLLIVAGAFVVVKSSRTPRIAPQPLIPSQITPIPTPTPDETANWKIYASPDGYSFKYPDNFTLNNYNEGSFMGIFLVFNGPSQIKKDTELIDGITLRTITFTTGTPKTLEEVANDLKQGDGVTSQLSKTSIGGKEAYSYTFSQEAKGKVIITTDQKGFLRISTLHTGSDESYPKTIDQILSTFRFD